MASKKCCIVFLFALFAAKYSNANWLCKDKHGKDFISKNPVSISREWIRHNRIPTLCLYKGLTISNGDYYFEMKVEGTDSKVEVGLTTDDALNGYPYKGFFYSSDLSDGSHVLRQRFGQQIDLDDSFESDSIEFIIRNNGEKINVYLKHFGVPLGLALSTTRPSVPLFPAVMLFGDGKVTITQKQFTEALQLRRWKHLLEGSFRFISFKEGDREIHPKCLDNTIQFHQYFFGHSDEQEEDFSVSFNDEKRRGSLWKDGGKWKYATDDTGAGIDGSQVSECVTFIEEVLKNTVSLTHTDSTVEVQSRDEFGIERSFEAQKVADLSPLTVTKNVFDGNN